MLDVGVVADPRAQCVVDELELRDHVVGALTHADLDVGAQLRGHRAFGARPGHVLLREPHPRHRVRHPADTRRPAGRHLGFSAI